MGKKIEFGDKHTPETIKKMKESAKARWAREKWKKEQAKKK